MAKERRRVIGVRERLEMKRAQQDSSNKPDPWLLRKLSVGIAVAIFGYSIYVVVVRVCAFALQRSMYAKLSVGSAAVVLVIECALLLMFIWSYMMVLFTSPGLARDHVPKSAAPALDEAKPAGSPSSSQEPISGPPYRSDDGHARTSGSSCDAPPQPQATPVSTPRQSDVAANDAEVAAETHPKAGALGGPVANILAISTAEPTAPQNPAAETAAAQGAQQPGLKRTPPTTALREEQWRYCRRCELVKPLRTHHCRHCGTCVLAMDHHCPWVGHCVGARNHKYFFNFCFWAGIYTAFVSIILITDLCLPSLSGAEPPTDVHEIVMLILAVLFMMFTLGMSSTHLWLILHNVTTIEQMGIARFRERENDAISRAHGYCNLVAKRRYLKRWNHEWGDPVREGNPFWLGARKNWASVMGEPKLGWFLPIPAGPSSNDGLDYALNPRYSANGRWQHRDQWPEEFR